jgi:hypothetical protein
VQCTMALTGTCPLPSLMQFHSMYTGIVHMYFFPKYCGFPVKQSKQILPWLHVHVLILRCVWGTNTAAELGYTVWWRQNKYFSSGFECCQACYLYAVPGYFNCFKKGPCQFNCVATVCLSLSQKRCSTCTHWITRPTWQSILLIVRDDADYYFRQYN